MEGERGLAAVFSSCCTLLLLLLILAPLLHPAHHMQSDRAIQGLTAAARRSTAAEAPAVLWASIVFFAWLLLLRFALLEDLAGGLDASPVCVGD